MNAMQGNRFSSLGKREVRSKILLLLYFLFPSCCTFVNVSMKRIINYEQHIGATGANTNVSVMYK